MRKIFLLLMITLLAFTNVEGEVFDPPVKVGDTYTFERYMTLNCTSMPNNEIDQELVGVRKLYLDRTEVITGIDTETKQIEIDYSYDYFGSEPFSNSDTETVYYYVNGFVSNLRAPYFDEHFEFWPVLSRSYIEPDFANITSQISDWILDTNGYHYTSDSIMSDADSIIFMGEPSLEEGVVKLDSNSRKWSIDIDLSSYMGYETYQVGREFQFNIAGVLDYHHTYFKTKKSADDDTCLKLTEVENTTPIATPSLPGFEIYFPLILIPIATIRRFKKK